MKKRTTTQDTHVVRTKDGKLVQLKMHRKLAILAQCTECMGWDDHPDNCTAKLCPLYPFRGKTLRTQKGNIDKETYKKEHGIW